MTLPKLKAPIPGATLTSLYNWIVNQISIALLNLVSTSVTTGSLVVKGVATEGYGLMTLKYSTGTASVSGGAITVPVAVPSNCFIVGCQLRIDEALVPVGSGVDYTANYSGGASQEITATGSYSANSKVDKFFVSTAVTAVTSGTTNITIVNNDVDPFDTGTVTAVVYYYQFTSLTDI